MRAICGAGRQRAAIGSKNEMSDRAFAGCDAPRNPIGAAVERPELDDRAAAADCEETAVRRKREDRARARLRHDRPQACARRRRMDEHLGASVPAYREML